jgi:hypothetical protein
LVVQRTGYVGLNVSKAIYRCGVCPAYCDVVRDPPDVVKLVQCPRATYRIMDYSLPCEPAWYRPCPELLKLPAQRNGRNDVASTANADNGDTPASYIAEDLLDDFVAMILSCIGWMGRCHRVLYN